MKKEAKVFIYFICIILVIGLHYLRDDYFSYISAIEDYNRGYYIDIDETEDSLEHTTYDNLTWVSMVHENHQAFSTYIVQKDGLFYHRPSEYRTDTMEGNQDLLLNWRYDLENEWSFYVFYRLNKDIDRIEVTLKSGEVIIYDKWQGNFIGDFWHSMNMIEFTYCAKNKNGDVIVQSDWTMDAFD